VQNGASRVVKSKSLPPKPKFRPVAPPSSQLLLVFLEQQAHCQAIAATASADPRQRALMFRLVGAWQSDIDRLRAQLQEIT